MASPSSTFALLLDGLQHPHMVQSTLMQLQQLGVTENILKATGAREKVGRFTSDSFFGPLARSILKEWDEDDDIEIIEISAPSAPPPSLPLPPSLPSPTNDFVFQLNDLLDKLWDSSQIETSLTTLDELAVTRDLLIKTEARKKILNVIFTRKLVCTPMGRLASRILAQWTIEFPDLPAPSTIHRPSSPDLIVAKVIRPKNIVNSSIGLTKKVRTCVEPEKNVIELSDSRESTASKGTKRKAQDIPQVKKMKKVCSSGKEVKTIYNELFTSTKKKVQTKLNSEKSKKGVKVLRPSETQKKKESGKKILENKKEQGKTLKKKSTKK